ncbi:MAG: 3-hydroxyacyl-CoA dehydrogenase family protein [Chloroflexota bacterium]|nr:3-hydroxyacyl-CoA dehydrogenase family protein [Chloroflexota bacterium]
MELKDIKTIAVIGGGTMGSQVSELLSYIGGYNVMQWSRSDETVKRGITAIEDRLRKFFVEKEKMTEDELKQVMGRITGTTSIEEAVKNADLVIESAMERMDIKKDVFEKIDSSAPDGAILSTNTSQMNITEIAAMTKRPEVVVGMHFFNPVSRMKLVEVVKGTLTNNDVVKVICELAEKLGKETVICKDFSYGFIANRAYRALRWEALDMIRERVASPQDIDKTLKLGYNLPMGPLELGDFSGAWGTYAVSEADAMKEFGPEKGKLHPLIRIMVRAGYTGGRHGKGIYAFWDEVASKW